MKRLPGTLLLTLLFCLPLLAGDNKNNTPDLNGTPDLIVSSDLGQQWVVRVEDLPATFCSVEEGGITPGTHTLVRFTVTTPNIGDADLYLGDPNVHVAANDGLYEFASCHHHYHFKHYATYELVDPATGFVWKAAKKGFCMLDTDPNPATLGEPAKTWQFRSCGGIGIPGNQGISHGWSDTYRFFLGGQYFLLDGGDGQAVVPPGTYMIRITVNPPYAPDSNGNCPRVKDPATGLCHQFAESNYANNVGTALINIPDHPGRQGVGPLNNTSPDGTEPIDHQ
ncbi:MAG TPA: lysyl oxidase family protein [Thermoanaerobaculia bacterium]